MDDVTASWRGRRSLVTCCTGFLGSAVVRELLARGAEVVGLVRDRVADAEFARHKLAGRVHVVHGRAEDTFRVHSALAVYEASGVFHLAAADPNKPDRATPLVLEAVRRFDPRVPVVVARPSPAPDVAPVSVAVPVGVARFGELFGGGDRNAFRVVPATAIGLLTGERGGGTSDGPARDFVPVRDAARACVAVAEALSSDPRPRVLDATFRSGWVATDREMAAAVREAFAGRPPHLAITDPPANPFGWHPAVGPAAALAATIDWYREFVRTRSFGTPLAAPPRRAAA